MTANEILREHFERKRRSGYSLRALARDLKVSPAFVSALFRTKKKVPLRLVKEFARVLDIDSETVLEIKRQLLPEPELSGALFKQPKASAAWKVTSKDSLSCLRHWYYLAAMELSQCTGFDGSPATVARRLGIPPETAALALRDLCALGLMKEDAGKFSKKSARIRLASGQSRDEIRNFHRQLLRKADEELELKDAEAFARRLVMGITVTASRDRIRVAKKMLNDALYEIGNYLAEGEGEEVYHLAAQLFPLTKKP